MMTVGEIIRKKREEKGLYLRHLAASIDIDQALLSKIERGDKKATKAQILKIAVALDIDIGDLMLQYLSENIAYQIADENNASEVLQAAESKIEYLRNHMKIK